MWDAIRGCGAARFFGLEDVTWGDVATTLVKY